MPNKHNASRRHHIPKMKFKVMNWAEYEAGLRRRGSLTLWITDEAKEKWKAEPRLTPGGQPHYSDLAIEASLMVRGVFKLGLRQTEGLIESVFHLMGIDLNTPDHSTLSRRARKLPLIPKGNLPDGPLHIVIDSTGVKVYGAGEWLEEKHGTRRRRSWRKLHLAVDTNTGMIVASSLTGKDVDDPSQVKPLLDQIEGKITHVMADGAYDGDPTYQTIAKRDADIIVVIPPRANAVFSAQADTAPSQRNQHIAGIEAKGRLGWQEDTGYGKRALVETTMGRYKSIIGDRLRARSTEGQEAEAAIGVAILNRMTSVSRPDSVRAFRKAA